MDTKALAEALEAWAADTVDDLNSFPEEPPLMSEAMPLVICGIRRKRRVQVDNAFRNLGYEQTHIEVIEAELRIFVEPRPSWTAEQSLYDILDQLANALTADGTLGERVDGASPLFDWTNDGEVQYEDGTHALMGTFKLNPGELKEA